MNRRIARKPILAPSARFFRAPFLACCAILFLACIRPAPQPARPLPPAALAVLKQRIAQIRELPFKRDVLISENGTSPSSDEMRTASLAQFEFVYKQVGLLPEAANLASDLAEYRRWKRLVSYDAQNSSVVTSPEAAAFGWILASNAPRRADQVPTVLGLALALQEQHFGWQERLRLINLEDRRLAFHALAYGDAVLLAQNHVRGNEPQRWPEDWQAILKLTAAIDRTANRLPDLLREKLTFPYREGSQFVNWAFATRGWQGVNALFDSPPLSSAQILHPERYYDQKQSPQRILPLGLLRRIADTSTMDQTLGEFLIRVLLTSQFSREQATQLASPWRGDYLSTFGTSERPMIIWYTNWQNEPSAAKFMQALKTILERRHRIRFSVSAEQPDSWTTSLSSTRSAVLQRNGSTVAWLEGQKNELFTVAATELWSDVEITAESDQLPFDSARWSGQLSRTRR